mmetsp:Transcript_9016/g.25897  ORF Transcript_9016/g.25897 Transcript_9016/m.25897 type:complete len:275 (+) Transcript_9016:1498-2322(+)
MGRRHPKSSLAHGEKHVHSRGVEEGVHGRQDPYHQEAKCPHACQQRVDALKSMHFIIVQEVEAVGERHRREPKQQQSHSNSRQPVALEFRKAAQVKAGKRGSQQDAGGQQIKRPVCQPKGRPRSSCHQLDQLASRLSLPHKEDGERGRHACHCQHDEEHKQQIASRCLNLLGELGGEGWQRVTPDRNLRLLASDCPEECIADLVDSSWKGMVRRFVDQQGENSAVHSLARGNPVREGLQKQSVVGVVLRDVPVVDEPPVEGLVHGAGSEPALNG